MRRYLWVLSGVVVLAAGCARSANVEQERTALLARDLEWSQTTKDLDKMASFFAPDASVYVSGMPIVTGSAAIQETLKAMFSTPGFSLQWTAAKADVGGAGDIGYTSGTYQTTAGAATETGKYVTVWKKQAGGQWMVAEDIFNADASPAPAAGQHTLVTPNKLAFGEAPPGLPPGAKVAVISGDPTSNGPYVLRAQMPAGYTIGPHWHPTDEHLTVLGGTFAVGMGETFDKAALQDVTASGYALMPAQMRHFAMAKTPVTLQVHGTGPFVINYVNATEDPRSK